MAPGGGPGGHKQILGGPRASPEAKSCSISGSPGGPRRLWGGLRGGIFGGLFGDSAWEPYIYKQVSESILFLLLGCFVFRGFRELFCFLVAAPAREWTFKKHETVLALPVLSACAAFCAQRENKKKRRSRGLNLGPKTHPKTNAGITASNIKQMIKIVPKLLRRVVLVIRRRLGSLLAARFAPGGCQNRLGRPGRRGLLLPCRGNPLTPPARALFRWAPLFQATWPY